MEEGPGEITILLQQWRSGDREAESKLFEILLPELRRIAGHIFRHERPNHTLQPTALVNEAFLRLVNAKIDWQNREHFKRVAARVMRRYLIDHARARPHVNFLPFEEAPDVARAKYTPEEWQIAVRIALDELEVDFPQRRKIVELRFALGFTDEEAAEELNVSLRSLQRESFEARKWLFQRLTASRE